MFPCSFINLYTKYFTPPPILLPAWKSIFKDLKLAVRIMPCNVSICWNSTYNMLNFALKYWKDIDVITDKRKLGLDEYELKPKA
ncbi:hypothetical protein EDD22DRAFT_773900 [Suillus occidentalis]|nr:hypothetical protein EDD22DRAFT_773900 [Suillus occidentalis]